MRYVLKFHAQGIIGNRLIVVGGTQIPGCGPEHVSNRAWLFDPKAGTYEDLPAAPEKLGKPEGILVGDDFYLFGGVRCPSEVPKGQGNYNRQMWRLTRRSGTWKWETLAPIPYARLFPMITRVGSLIILIGGHSEFDPGRTRSIGIQGSAPVCRYELDDCI